MVSRALYVTHAREHRLISHTYSEKEVSGQHVVPIHCHSITEMMEFAVNKVFARFRATEEFMTIIGIHLITLLMGPAFSSDIAGDGPGRDEDNECKDRDELDEGSTSSESKSNDRECRPPTPTKPQGMTKRKYKNLVRSHRPRYPKAAYQDSNETNLKPTQPQE